MKWIDFEHETDEIVSSNDTNEQPSKFADESSSLSLGGGDGAAAALDLVSEAAAAIRELEKQSADAVARAHKTATALVEKLEFAEARAERGEAALCQAEAEIASLAALLEEGRRDLKTLQADVVAKENALAAANKRADDAERRADDAAAAVQRIVEAIRAQLPVKLVAHPDEPGGGE